MERIEHHASFDGWQDVYQHESTTLGCTMKVGVYLPPQAQHGKVPVLYWLSGLTCTEQNFITKPPSSATRPNMALPSSRPIAVLAAKALPTILPMTSDRGRVSTSTPHRNPGLRIIGCTTTSCRNCRR